MENKNGINWEKWGVIIAVISLLVTVFGVSFSCNSCFSCTSDKQETVIEGTDDYEDLPTEEEIKQQIQQTTGKVWIEDAQILSFSETNNSHDYSFLESTTDNTGNEHSSALLLINDGWNSTSSEELQFYTNGQYESLNFTCALSELTRDTESIVTVSVNADDEKIWSKKIQAGVLPEDVSLDISGAIVVSIVCVRDNDEEYDTVKVVFGEAYFKSTNENGAISSSGLPSSEEVLQQVQQATGKVWLDDAQVLSFLKTNNSHSYSFFESTTDNTGMQLHSALLLSNDGWYDTSSEELQFFANGQYEKLNFTCALSELTRDTESIVTVSVNVDDQKIWSKKIQSGVLPEDVSLDISGAIVVSIVCVRDNDKEYDTVKVILGEAYFETE